MASFYYLLFGIPRGPLSHSVPGLLINFNSRCHTPMIPHGPPMNPIAHQVLLHYLSTSSCRTNKQTPGLLLPLDPRGQWEARFKIVRNPWQGSPLSAN